MRKRGRNLMARVRERQRQDRSDWLVVGRVSHSYANASLAMDCIDLSLNATFRDSVARFLEMHDDVSGDDLGKTI